MSYPAPYVPRRLTFEVAERIDSEGRVTVPLDEAALVETLNRVREFEVAAVAVCLLWSIVNPVHEERVGELVAEELPGVPYTLSHRLNPIIREYRRASSTAIDASLKPLMQRHLDEMAVDLRRRRLRRRAAGGDVVRRRADRCGRGRPARSTRSTRLRRWRPWPLASTPPRGGAT